MYNGGVTEVGSVRPVEDFKEMLARRDVDLVQVGEFSLNFL